MVNRGKVTTSLTKGISYAPSVSVDSVPKFRSRHKDSSARSRGTTPEKSFLD